MTKFSSCVCAVVCMAAAAFSTPASAELIYGIAAVGNAPTLVTFDSAAPGALLSGVALSGLQANESISGIDFRPLTGQLYGLGSTSRLYTINPATGAASAVGGQFSPLLNGFNFGFDFNPVIDRIRVVAETNQNLVLNPMTGAVQTVAPNVAYAVGDANVGRDPNVVNSAYTNNFSGAASTTLYGIDTGLDILVTQVAATGALSTVGSLNFDINAVGGFDISGTTGTAYAAVTLSGESVSRLITINLANGTPSGFGQIDGGLIISALTVAPAIPEPTSLALAGLGLVGAVLFRRRTR